VSALDAMVANNTENLGKLASVTIRLEKNASEMGQALPLVF